MRVKRRCSAVSQYRNPARRILISLSILFINILCLSAEAYIDGPWLWMIASGADIDSDQLAVASEGIVTENLVATYGVNEGDAVGQLQWTRGRILPEVDCLLWRWGCYSDNVNRVINRIGLSNDRGLNYHSAYALINIFSPKARKNVAMGVGSDDSVKVWLNGKVVHVNNVDRGTTGIQDLFRVNLNAGDNLLLVKVSDNLWNWGMFFDIYLAPGDFRTFLPTATLDISLATHLFQKYSAILQDPEIQEVLPDLLSRLQEPEIQALLTPLTINTVAENPDLLAQFGVQEKAISFIKENAGVRVMLRDPDFQTLVQNPNALSEFAALVTGEELAPPEQRPLAADVDGNGVVNILDLVRIATRLGQTGPDPADVNRDGTVNIRDIVLAAALMGEEAAAPSSYAVIEIQRGHLSLQTEDIQLWLTQAQGLDLSDPTLARGMRVLKHLVMLFVPKETALLSNYPNPFNPETWIPYQLAIPADVSISIYAADGKLVRILNLGHQAVGIYHQRGRAAYWDGRNTQGEPVASGVYFYTFTAGEFTATRKMLIRK
ncbi:MAG: T9SS type A sorting domain-containing protein [Candidatus Poribacteria bacterium]|nr:T9SS type A sorting domain-containing protein [Candidatus Poribacteria bacterium]